MNNNNLEFWQTATKSNLHKNIIYKNNILSNQGKNTQQNLQRNTHPSQDKFICTYIDFHWKLLPNKLFAKKKLQKKTKLQTRYSKLQTGSTGKMQMPDHPGKKTIARTFL